MSDKNEKLGRANVFNALAAFQAMRVKNFPKGASRFKSAHPKYDVGSKIQPKGGPKAYVETIEVGGGGDGGGAVKFDITTGLQFEQGLVLRYDGFVLNGAPGGGFGPGNYLSSPGGGGQFGFFGSGSRNR